MPGKPKHKQCQCQWSERVRDSDFDNRTTTHSIASTLGRKPWCALTSAEKESSFSVRQREERSCSGRSSTQTVCAVVLLREKCSPRRKVVKSRRRTPEVHVLRSIYRDWPSSGRKTGTVRRRGPKMTDDDICTEGTNRHRSRPAALDHWTKHAGARHVGSEQSSQDQRRRGESLDDGGGTWNPLAPRRCS